MSPESVTVQYTVMPPASEDRREENPESCNKEKKQEDEQNEEGEHEQRETEQVQKENDEELQVLTKPDSVDHIVCVHSQAIIRPDSEKGPPDRGCCEEKQSTQSRQKELLLNIQHLDCSAQVFESVQRFLS